MRIWIDAAPAQASARVFGLSLVERIERLTRRIPSAQVTVDRGPGAAGRRLKAFAAGGPEPILAVDGAGVFDSRLLPFLAARDGSVAVTGGEGPRRAAAMRIGSAAALAAVPDDAAGLGEIADAAVTGGAARRLEPTEFPTFVMGLRRDLPYHLERLPDAAARRAYERFLFWSNYKGSTDFLTRWVFPLAVWPLTRLATAIRLHPNWITLAGVVLALAAVPLFMAGWVWTSIVMCWVMAVLDSVDGKVARVTMTESAIGNFLDHGLDIVHPPLWYLGWAWWLSDGALEHPAFIAAIWLCGFYVADRLVLAVPKALWGRGLHAMDRIDSLVRTVISRRNVNLLIFTLGLALGAPVAAFYVVTVWAGATLAWHAGRTAWLAATRPRVVAAT
ncbi:CDP-alcohol phosphatidyltransferase family protein [Desertibaculum subflavum]|uniref:CDP-alcohol phosphatidyltransferase family protein n=1 Tax=Desertibaculum subflavum TaxID=2268458 RepID=UPI0013C519CE